ncbi:pentapeptide repeat-containing protein [Micromonospora chokoriensis]|uniref:pentapeptide repeat-containing protein n=1 Tax=Micromonospora chokoriensis TaxID=356851 RepID=UPI003B284C9C
MFLTGADLRRADLRGASLQRTIANGADLRWAWLGESDLRSSAISGANLRHALLDGAQLERVHFDGSDLRGAQGLTAEQLSVAFIDSTTKLPEALRDDPWVLARVIDCEAWREAHEREPWACPPQTLRPEATAPASSGTAS